jgi:hypothetical protein|tara:strand:+ start:283 stop:816 length:534 start_codon:yes stop_codon:yes gene_type:complete
MKKLIKDVLEDMSTGQINLESEASRELIANTIMAAIKSEGGWFLDIGTIDGKKKVDTPIYEKSEEQKARETWVCSICGKNTYDVDWDYIGSDTNHLGCELELGFQKITEDRREKNWSQKKHEDKVFETDKLAEEIVSDNDTGYIYESPDGGKTVYQRKVGESERELVKDWDKINVRK